jgi:hypothetical protein
MNQFGDGPKDASRTAGLAARLGPMLNAIGIVGDSDLGRLVGCHRDARGTWYRVRHISGHPHGSEILHAADVPFVSLRGRLDPTDYARMDVVFTRGGAPPIDYFLVTQEGQAVGQDAGVG